MGQYECVIIGLAGMGLGLIAAGISIRLGYWKKWYLGPDDPIFYPKPGAYGFITLGLSFFCTAMVLVLSEPWQTFATWVTFAFAGLSVLLVGLQPSWIKPKWVRYLEEENGDILDRLIEEARWTKDWDKRIATQEGLEAWVTEVREKWDEPRVELPPHAGRPYIPKGAQGRWIIAITVLVMSSALGQLFLGNGLIGFIAGFFIVGGISLLLPPWRPKEE